MRLTDWVRPRAVYTNALFSAFVARCYSWNISTRFFRLNLSSPGAVPLSLFRDGRSSRKNSWKPSPCSHGEHCWAVKAVAWTPLPSLGLFLFSLEMTNRKTLWLCSCTVLTANYCSLALLITIPPARSLTCSPVFTSTACSRALSSAQGNGLNSTPRGLFYLSTNSPFLTE